jgi:hypothetical protein
MAFSETFDKIKTIENNEKLMKQYLTLMTKYENIQNNYKKKLQNELNLYH